MRRILLVYILWCVLPAGCSPPPGPDAVFLIVVDTLRADRVTSYDAAPSGHATPALDRLASRGLRFENAYATGSWTLPSMGALHTSLYPTQLGLVERAQSRSDTLQWRARREQVRATLPLEANTLAERLTAAGFAATAFVNQPFLNVGEGFLQGFDAWCFASNPRNVQWHDLSNELRPRRYSQRTDLGLADELLVEEFENWLPDHASDKPFVWLHLLKPHWPYRPTPPEGQPQAPWNNTESTNYDAEVREVDTLLDRVLTAIDQHVGLDRALVVLTSDHGEEFEDHGRLEHGHSTFEEVVRVPLLLAGPGVPAATTSAYPAQGIDILPTILELTGQPADPPLEGHSLVGRWGSDGPRDLYIEGVLYGPSERAVVSFDADGRATKLIREANQVWLHDLSRDPAERNNLAGTGNPGPLLAQLREHHERILASRVRGPAQDLDPHQLEEALRNLGYVE